MRYPDKWNLSLWRARKCCFWNFLNPSRSKISNPEQEHVRMSLERIGRREMENCAFENGSFVFKIDHDDNEPVKFEHEP